MHSVDHIFNRRPGAEKHTVFTDQEIKHLYLMKDRLIKEKPKYMKQKTLDNWFKKATETSKQLSSTEHPITSASATPDVILHEDPDNDLEYPEVTPAENPEVTPAKTPEVTSAETPEVTPAKTPEVTPAKTPDVTPAETPDVTPAKNPDVTRM
ncbi:endoglucanase-like [Homarus americanus]|uniref:endoglucanase-like n=1 Tax=Homarus americanus TaxID=6706 RepID=UPI001C46D00E|nr:endoglucanase-like [Homarus americanus]